MQGNPDEGGNIFYRLDDILPHGWIKDLKLNLVDGAALS
jgi:hypothetical protein